MLAIIFALGKNGVSWLNPQNAYADEILLRTYLFLHQRRLVVLRENPDGSRGLSEGNNHTLPTDWETIYVIHRPNNQNEYLATYDKLTLIQKGLVAQQQVKMGL